MAGREAKRWRSTEQRLAGVAAMHPLRQAVAVRLHAGGAAGAAALAETLDESSGRIEYHLAVLIRAGLARAVPRRRPSRPLYRLSDGEPWLRELLGVDKE